MNQLKSIFKNLESFRAGSNLTLKIKNVRKLLKRIFKNLKVLTEKAQEAP